jgi:hypothetical protein
VTILYWLPLRLRIFPFSNLTDIGTLRALAC